MLFNQYLNISTILLLAFCKEQNLTVNSNVFSEGFGTSLNNACLTEYLQIKMGHKFLLFLPKVKC